MNLEVSGCLLRPGPIKRDSGRSLLRSKLSDLEAQNSNHIVGSYIVVGSTKRQSRHEQDFAVVTFILANR